MAVAVALCSVSLLLVAEVVVEAAGQAATAAIRRMVSFGFGRDHPQKQALLSL